MGLQLLRQGLLIKQELGGTGTPAGTPLPAALPAPGPPAAPASGT